MEYDPLYKKEMSPPCGHNRDSLTCLFFYHMILSPTEVLESITDHEDTLLVSMKYRKAINTVGSDHASSYLSFASDARDVMGKCVRESFSFPQHPQLEAQSSYCYCGFLTELSSRIHRCAPQTVAFHLKSRWDGFIHKKLSDISNDIQRILEVPGRPHRCGDGSSNIQMSILTPRTPRAPRASQYP
jgi:hypothetical protein